MTEPRCNYCFIKGLCELFPVEFDNGNHTGFHVWVNGQRLGWIADLPDECSCDMARRQRVVAYWRAA